MGAWSASILGNDTACEVYEKFIELYNCGENTESIAGIILEEQEENLLYDKTNVWIGLALGCWECKVLTPEIYFKVKDIVDIGEDLEFNKQLDADAEFIEERKKNLNAFIKKISTEREKPRVRKKPPKPIEIAYKTGMCLAYENLSGNYIGVYVIKSEHFKNKGEIKFCFLDFESKILPEIEKFKNGRLFGLKKLGKEWRFAEYCGNTTNVHYEKADKDDFFRSIPKIFTIIGKLKEPDYDKYVNNFRGGFLNLKDPLSIIQSIEAIRLEGKNEHELSDITLGELLDKVGI